MRSSQRGFTLIELLVVIAIIAILASILFPVFSKAREKARQATCISQVRQIATAMQMYVQDNDGQYPGTDGGSWVGKLAAYLGNSDKMFACPSDTTKDSGASSYALSGLLVRKNGAGVKESNVNSPSEVGALCDATPTETYPAGRLLFGGAQALEADNAATPSARHSKGVVAGYCDGHAKYFQGKNADRDLSNGITRAFIAAGSLGLVDNPLGCVGINAGANTIAGANTVAVGGEYNGYPLLMAAAQMYGNYYTRGFLGANATTGQGTNYCWASTTGALGFASTGVAIDALVFIVAKSSKVAGIGGMTNSTYVANTAWLAGMFGTGYLANTVQVYKMNETNTQTAAYALNILGLGAFGTDSVEVDNDLEMVEKVANDPYGIGFCSSVFADTDRVSVMGVTSGTTTYFWPSPNAKTRWVVPATAAGSSWPFKRQILLSASGTEGTNVMNALWGNGAVGGNLLQNLKSGPLFKTGYWPGNL